MTTRDRVTDFAHRHASDEPRDSNVQVAAAEVGQTLDYLGFAVEDVECARVEYISAKERCEAAIAAGGSDDGQERFEAQRRAYFLLQYRIDTFFFFARVLLDDVVTLIDVGCAPSGMKIGSHSNIEKNLPQLVAAKGVPIPPELSKTLEELEGITHFRDKYVAHRSRLNPGATRGLMMSSESSEIGLGVGWMYPKGNEPLGMIQSGDPTKLHAVLLRYVDEVLDFIESVEASAGRSRDSVRQS